MGAAAQFHGERSTDLHNTHVVAVVFTEQRHRTHGFCLVQGGFNGVHVPVRIHCLIGDSLNLPQLIWCQRVGVVEVKPQVAWLIHRPCLHSGRPQDLP